MTRFSVGLIVTLLSSAVAAPLWAQGNYTAASCNYSDVNAVINGPTHIAVDGDVINIPAGTCTWTNQGIVVPAGIGITIEGTGTPNSTTSTFGASASCSQTAITQSGGTTFHASPNYGASTMRLSCMAINYTATTASIAWLMGGTCTSSGCPNIRIDNITYNNWNNHAAAGLAYGITAADNCFGVIDHNTVPSAGSIVLTEINHGSYFGVGFNGDNAWAQSEDWGSYKFLFFENNILDGFVGGLTDNEASVGGLAQRGGSRGVARYNQFTNMRGYTIGWHGTESNGRPRSGRAFEYYGNTYTCGTGNSCDSVSGWRGGNGLVWGNTTNFTGASLNSFFAASNYRAQGNINWGACDGSSPYDVNDGVTYVSGTISAVSGSGPATTVTINQTGGTDTCISSNNCTANHWSTFGAPHSLHDVTKNNGGEITSSGTNTVVVNNSGGLGAWTPQVGDSIQILRATVCIDQPGGRGAGFLYTGNSGNGGSPVQSAAQVLSPTYGWMNSFTPNKDFGTLGPVYSTGTWAGSGRIIRNREIYTEDVNQAAQSSSTSPFDGSTSGTAGKGIGHGTLANRPTNCTPNPVGGALGGVGYWATDSGPAWNNGSQGGQLFVCTATNTWTLYYTPYTYPHPLIQGTGGPAPPSNLKAFPN